MKRITLSMVVFITIFSVVTTTAQTTKQKTSSIQVIQFHSEHRCVTCMKIEKLTKATLAKSFPNIPFKLYNVDNEANARIAEQFNAVGTALFLYNPKTGKKLNLTEFAFMKAANETAFDFYLKKYIEEFLKN